MSDTTLDPRAVDRQAVKEEFFRNIEQYALDDANGTATRQVQLKLRERNNLKQWGVALEMLHQKVSNSDVRQRIMMRKMECSNLKQTEAKVEQMLRTNASIERTEENANWFRNQLKEHGFEFPVGTSTKEIDCILLASLNSKLAALLAK